MFTIKKLFISIVISFVLSACVPNNNSKFGEIRNATQFTSPPISISFQESYGQPYYFLIEKKPDNQNYKLRVHWVNLYKQRTLFNGMNTKITFLLDNKEILHFSPIQMPKTILYNINTNGCEEEAVFELTKDQIHAIAYSRTVTTNLQGKDIALTGYFNRWSSFKHFRNFLKNNF